MDQTGPSRQTGASLRSDGWPPERPCRRAPPVRRRRAGRELAYEALYAALEVVHLELDVDGLLEASDGIGVRNTSRTGHDRCYTRS
jgi:hypothetical protein